MLFTDKNLIICGFPGVGKTMAEEKRKDTIDLESSNFKWVPADALNPVRESVYWPKNYLDEIETLYTESYRKIILVSTHPEVIKGLQKRRLPFLIVVPDLDRNLKNEYLIRFLMRGSSVSFIKEMSQNWYRYLYDIDDYGETVIWLGSGQYLADILPY